MKAQLDVFLVMLASSYLTLGLFEPQSAANLWAAYATATFLLSGMGLVVSRKK